MKLSATGEVDKTQFKQFWNEVKGAFGENPDLIYEYVYMCIE